LSNRNDADHEDVAYDGEPSERVRPVDETGGQKWERDLDETVKTEFFEHTSV
jgi:hypothetical protein